MTEAPQVTPPERHPGHTDAVLLPHHHELAQLQRLRGRAHLRPDEAEMLAAAHDTLSPLRTDEDAEVVRLLTRPLSTELEIPEYFRYTCLHAYGWFLDHFPNDPAIGALCALYVTLGDLLAVERDASAQGKGPDSADERIARLEQAITAVRGTLVDPVLGTSVGHVIDRASTEADLARRSALLAECTRFPRSVEHEEHVFLRVVQSCELLFFLVRHLALEVVVAAERFPVWAAARLTLGGECALHLNRVLHILRTLTPEAFMSFREATGAASAVQSLNYHAMEISVYGYDPRKADIFDSIGHLRVFTRDSIKRYRPLAAVLAAAPDERLARGWHALDRSLSKWRGAHYRFARNYLEDGKPASGGTEGASYVKKFVKKDACIAGTDRHIGLALLPGFLYR